MQNESSNFRQPVAVHFFAQSNYPDEPFRQIQYEILFIERGEGTLFLGNSEAEIHTGDFIFINSFEEHFIRKINENTSFYCYRILFDISALGSQNDPCRIFFEKIKLCRFLKMPAELCQRFFNTAKIKKNSEEKELILRSIILDVISYAVETEQYERFSQLSELEKRNLSAIENALNFIRDNYSETLSLGAILQLTNYSKSHFIRLFKESTGMNVSEYINKFRIEKACLDLIYTNKNITE